MRRVLLWGLAFAAAVYANSAFSSSLPRFSTDIEGHLFSLQGSNTVGERLAPELVKDFLEAKGLVNVAIHRTNVENEYRVIGFHPNSSRSVSVELAAHGSSTAFWGLASGEADIGMSSRRIKPKEVEALSHLGDMISFAAEQVVAIDGLAIIVHPSNSVHALTLDDIARIFSGEITDWSALGRSPGPIRLYARDHKSGTWDTFKSLVLRSQYTLDGAARRFESNDEISRLVQNDENGIGFVGLASVGNAKPLAVSDRNTRPLQPTLLSVATEDYLLARRLFMYVPPVTNSPLIHEFLEFVQSEVGQERVGKVGYVAQNPMGLPSQDLAALNPQYQQLVTGAERLSVNIRFQAGSAELDNKARQDILRLTRFMQKPEQLDKRVLLIGFGDAKQSPRRARVLSQLRAVTVRSALREHGITTLPVQGLGDNLPVADHDSANRAKNQRVEIWLI